jgi:hypothetical protein
MDRNLCRRAALISTCVLSIAAPLLAHHGASEYDMTKIVSLNATVKQLQFVNPHTLLVFTVKDDAGKVSEWDGELPSPNLLSRRGWSRSTLKPGDQVTVIGAPAKNGQNGMQVKKLVFPDGHEMPERFFRRIHRDENT